jgi:hypothetical protein
VWRRVSEYDARYGPDPTSSFTGHLDRAMPDVGRLVDDLRALPGQSGVVIGIGGQPAMAEVFDSPATLRQELGPILAAAGMDAVGADPVPTPSRRARRFLDRAAKVAFVEEAPAGIGATARGRSEHVEASGIVWRDRLLHVTFMNVRHPLYAGASA